MYTDTEIIKVNLMGRFQISCGDKILDEDKICSAKGIRLLTLLLLNLQKAGDAAGNGGISLCFEYKK